MLKKTALFLKDGFPNEVNNNDKTMKMNMMTITMITMTVTMTMFVTMTMNIMGTIVSMNMASLTQTLQATHVFKMLVLEAFPKCNTEKF